MKLFARTVCLALITIASSGLADTLWRQYGFNEAHTSYNDSETALSPLTVGRLALFWTSEPFQAVGTAPTLGPNSIFVASDGHVRALLETSGVRRWGRLSCSGEGTVQPAFGKSLLLVGDGGGDLAAYHPGTGKQLWCDDESGSIVSAPAVENDFVFITNGVDAVALDQFSGQQHWRYTSADFTRLTTTPAVANGVVFVTGQNSIFALDGITGRKLWRTNLEEQANISAASVANGIVYVGGSSLYALSASDGHLLWRKNSVGINVCTPAIAEGKVFVNSQDPDFGLFAFDATTGAFLWKNRSPGESLSTLTVANGVIYDIAEDGELMMFETEHGHLLATISDPDGKPFREDFGSQPIVANGTVYVSTGDPSSSNRVDAFRLGP
jgi:outer membrane protein assembly factor BamB